MECRMSFPKLRTVLLTAFFLTIKILAAPLFAQDIEFSAQTKGVEEGMESENILPDSPDSPDANYYITQDEHSLPKFIQKLSWNKIPDIKKYHVQIQQRVDSNWSTVLDKDTNTNSIEVSLASGHYRFEVAVINLFDKEEKNSGWTEFEVLKATQPKISSAQTNSIYLNSKKADGIFTISGENLTDRTLFTMEQKNSDPPKILYGKILDVDEESGSVRVQFDLEKITEGEYDILAQNPGGLSVVSKTIHIKNKKDREWHIQISAGYTLPYTVYDEELQKFSKTKIYPASGRARITFLPFKTGLGYFGISAAGSFTKISASTNAYTLRSNLLNAFGLLVFERPFFDGKFMFDLHGGAGLSMLTGTYFEYSGTDYKSPDYSSAGLAYTGGFAIQYYPAKKMFVEVGADFVHSKFSDMSVGMLYPSISIGGMF